MVSTKVELSYNKIARIQDLDELAEILFPNNRNHQKVFIAIFVELKWAESQFLPALESVADKYGLSHRVLEGVRAKMRRMGFIDHVSRFNSKHGYREGWVFSNRFLRSLEQLAGLVKRMKERTSPMQEKKDRDALLYVPDPKQERDPRFC